MHQSFESPIASIRALGKGGGGGSFTSDTLHVGSPEGGEFAGSLGLRIPYQRNKRGSHSLVSDFIFVPHSNFAYHILQSILTITVTINICQYLVSLSHKMFLFVIVELTSGPD